MPPKTTSSRSGKSSTRRYDLSDKFFYDAIRSAVNDTLFSPVSLPEKEIVRLKPGFNTACWAFLPPHQIFIGTDLFQKEALKEELSEELQRKYIANHYHHERGHALFTQRDMPKMLKMLKAIDCKFSIYNLFEDAWMEERYRVKAEYKFEWLTIESLMLSPRPESLLFALIQAEGDVDVVQTALTDWKPTPPKVDPGNLMAAFMALFQPDPEDTKKSLADKFVRVVYYYQKMIAARDSFALIPILNNWLDEWGRPPEMPDFGGMADMGHSASLMTNPDAVKEFEKGCTAVNSPSSSTADDDLKEFASKKEVADVNHTAVATKGRVLSKNATPVDKSRTEKLARRFMKFFEEKSRVVSTRTPQKKISARHFALKRAPYRKVEITGRGCRDVFLEIDCSGSMSGCLPNGESHIMEGKVLLSALSLLARRGYVTGHVVLSAVNSGQPEWELFKLPVAQEVIDKIQGYAGAEGLEYALKANLPLIRKADFVFVYTDGQICDAPIDKSFFHRHGVYTWGLYAGTEASYLEELLKYFDKAIMRENAEALIDAMLAQNK